MKKMAKTAIVGGILSLLILSNVFAVSLHALEAEPGEAQETVSETVDAAGAQGWNNVTEPEDQSGFTQVAETAGEEEQENEPAQPQPQQYTITINYIYAGQ
ncbi:MAG: hypothetical protein ACK5JF_09080 [Oscillospiraceae bacterium]